VVTRPFGISLTTWYTSSKKLGVSALLWLAEFMNFFIEQKLLAGLWNGLILVWAMPATMSTAISFC
jgi:hypothetical protein